MVLGLRTLTFVLLTLCLYCQVFAVFETNAGSEALTKYKTPSPKYQVQVPSAKYKAQRSNLKVHIPKLKAQSSKNKDQSPDLLKKSVSHWHRYRHPPPDTGATANPGRCARCL